MERKTGRGRKNREAEETERLELEKTKEETKVEEVKMATRVRRHIIRQVFIPGPR